MDQIPFLFKNSGIEVDDGAILQRANFKEALRFAKIISGHDEKHFALSLGIDPAQWSRIWANQGHFPTEKVDQFIQLCGNLIPPRYLALKFGYTLVPLQSALEIENQNLKEQIKKQAEELEAIKKFFKETK